MLVSGNRHKIYMSVISVLLFPICTTYADDYFEADFVTDPYGKKLAVDLSSFEKSAYLPGNYRTDIFINDNYVDTADIQFDIAENQTELTPCLSAAQLLQYGIKADNYGTAADTGQCYDLRVIPDAKTQFIPSENRLVLRVPQIALDSQRLDKHLEQRWDDGIPALFADYSFSGRNLENTENHNKDNSYYLNLRSGLNIGAWRYRNYGTWNRDQDGSSHWETQLNYLERPVRAIKSRLLFGDNFSDSRVFDNVAFRGVKLWSDNQMYPDYASVYAPAITGVAASDSTIEVFQNGHVIYRTNVPAGPYELTDVVPLNNGDNLEVVQTGPDGGVQRFIVPFSTLDFLQRKGHIEYSVTGGQYRPSSSDNQQGNNKYKFLQSDAFYGLTDNITVFGGIQASSRYQAYDAGIGLNIPDMGALTADVMLTRADPEFTDTLTGQAFRLRYSKGLNQFGTNITFVGYRYMRGDYLTMQDMFDYYQGNSDESPYSRRKNQFDITLTQQLPYDMGQLTATSSYQTYNNLDNNNERKVESYNVGYSNTFNYFSMNLNYAYYKNSLDNRNERNDTDWGYRNGQEKNNDHVLSLTLSIPLSGPFKDNWINYGFSSNKDGDIDNYVGVGGLALEERNLSWNAQQGYGNRSRGNYGSLYGRYKNSHGDLNAGYSYQKHNRQVSYGASGSLMATQYGVTASRPMGETNALVRTPGAGGIKIENDPGAKTNMFGLAVVPELIPYRSNILRLAPDTLPADAEVATPLNEVFPTRGAIVLADYSTRIGKKMLVTLRDRFGETLPFGASTTVPGNEERFYVSNYGRVYLSGVQEADELTVTWGDKNQYQCSFSYDLSEMSSVNGLYIFDGTCQ